MSFIESLHKSTNKTARTLNGAISNRSTLDPLLDFFSNAGAMRGREADAVSLFNKAFAQEPQLALRCLMYLRDVRGGQRERSVPRAIFSNLEAAAALSILKHVPEYGRWDDLQFLDRSEEIKAKVALFIHDQLREDEAAMAADKSISLMAKWLPSENASSRETRKEALMLAKYLGLKPSQYRKKVVALRKYYNNFLERLMSENRWSEIDYEHLPSQAHRKHVKAFQRHDSERYGRYLVDVKMGKKKINSKTTFTYEIYDLLGLGTYGAHADQTTIDVAQAMWNALPDYTNGQNALVLADVSGSMNGRPMSISTTLAVYFAERNKGPFAGYYMTFTDVPTLTQVTDKGNIYDKLNFVENHNVGYNTNLYRAFRTILDTAIQAKASQDELPQVLYIISDMQFDRAGGQLQGHEETNFETAQREFKEAGYELPHVVYWNVNAIGSDAPATKYDDKVTLISGASQSTFQHVVAGKTPIESMLDILNSERYERITYAE